MYVKFHFVLEFNKPAAPRYRAEHLIKQVLNSDPFLHRKSGLERGIIGLDHLYGNDELIKTIPIPQQRSFIQKVIFANRVCHMTKFGRTYRFLVLVVIGDGNGRFGIGQSNREQFRDAVTSGFVNCFKTFISLPLIDSRTIPYGFTYTVHKTKLHVFPSPPGTSLRCPKVVYDMCVAIGIKDLKVRVEGSNNPMNVAKAFYEGLRTQLDIDTISLLRGTPINTLESLLNPPPPS